jgi:hypothetical protein
MRRPQMKRAEEQAKKYDGKGAKPRNHLVDPALHRDETQLER